MARASADSSGPNVSAPATTDAHQKADLRRRASEALMADGEGDCLAAADSSDNNTELLVRTIGQRWLKSSELAISDKESDSGNGANGSSTGKHGVVTRRAVRETRGPSMAAAAIAAAAAEAAAPSTDAVHALAAETSRHYAEQHARALASQTIQSHRGRQKHGTSPNTAVRQRRLSFESLRFEREQWEARTLRFLAEGHARTPDGTPVERFLQVRKAIDQASRHGRRLDEEERALFRGSADKAIRAATHAAKQAEAAALRELERRRKLQEQVVQVWRKEPAVSAGGSGGSVAGGVASGSSESGCAQAVTVASCSAAPSQPALDVDEVQLQIEPRPPEANAPEAPNPALVPEEAVVVE